MKAKICDRCHVTYTENDTPYVGVAPCKETFNGGWVTTTRIDLCDGCIKDFWDFMESNPNIIVEDA
ncbi:hypothetical protein [Turicimonas muris]|uniref:hypothetical protein n=1 Tax=Turicimonas muris TaxID=1796652 RepID=UPI002608C8E5|nr:hypothetical protein [Turicimonas muris]